MPNITIVNSLPEADWRQFVEQHSQGNIFHTPEMFKVFSRTKGYAPELWAAVSGGKILALILPVKISLMKGFFQPITSRSIVYGSVLYSSGYEGIEALELLVSTYIHEANNKPLFTELRNLTDLGEIQPLLSKQGFQYEDHLNYLINLNRPIEAIFNSIGSRTRKTLRHGFNKESVIVEEINEKEELELCYNLIKQTYWGARVPLADSSLFDAAFDILYPLGMIRFTSASVDKSIASASVELL